MGENVKTPLLSFSLASISKFDLNRSLALKTNVQFIIIFNFPDMQSKMNLENEAKQSWSSG